ncbi:hypothetical protein PVAND_011120 [Polypedilum vanderplanki]|uniref:Zinc finger protein n=1 Tax=Polypedilum vanderplanki TaxID=319348 RepID=A0A9J6CJG2_POLVA|nr:hypothetical protein PVAND_011120 [Polypedilum vanderplanki]
MDISMANLLIPPLNQTSNVAHSVKNICGICNGLHYTGLCNELTDKIIPDKPHSENLSRYSVPDGLMVIDDYGELKKSMVITAQKFAKGTRFGPVLAPKSYVPPSRPNKFPLVIFNEIWHGDPFIDDLSDDIKELFNVRNYYLDCSDETKCNWMIHVDIAKYSNEQNLMAYQENDQIYYTSTRDIELGDILKVWYSPSYATRMGVSLLQEATNEFNLYTNVRHQVSTFDCDLKLNDDKHSDMTNNNYLSIAPTTSSPSSEISLPPVNSLMKNQSHSPNYSIDFDNLILMAKNEQQMSGMSYQMDFIDNYNLSSSISDVDKMSHSSSSSIKPIKFTEMNDAETQKYACELCTRKYITKSNLEKHMRSHDLFMCVVCMKMFQNPDELKEHDCFKQKSSAKKSLFHCGICWKVLSNSWSLNRHMKIHRNITMTPDTSSQEKSDDVSDELLSVVTNQNLLIQEPELYTIESHCDVSNDMDETPIENMSHETLIGGFMTTDPLDVHAWAEPISQQDSLLHDQDLSTQPPQFDFEEQLNQETQKNHQQQQQQQQQTFHQENEQDKQQQQEIVQSIQMQAIEEIKSNMPNYDKCIVCARAFKNPNSLEKHLRNVHTAHIVRPELTTSIKKSSEYRRIVLNKKPIKENVAKALVSKLNKKNQQQQNIEQAGITTVAVNETTQVSPQFTQSSHTAIMSDATWNGNSLAPISSASDKNGHIENGNTIIIISSNIELNPANTTNGYTFANYHHQAALPKLVPISGLKSSQAVTSTGNTATTTFNISPKHEISNDNFSDIGEKFPNTSPKVFIIDKSNGEHSKTQMKQSKAQQQQQQVLTQDDPNEQHQCPECEKVFQKKYQLKRHQEIHENLFYFCPFCKRSPVKARSSLRKHFIKDHPEHQETWQASNFMSTLLKKYEKIKKSSHESHDSTKKYKKEGKKESKKKKEKLVIESNDTSIDNNHLNNHRCEIINDQPLPQVSIDEETHQQQQIILSNLFLDPITLDEENNLIKYTLAGEDDFIMNGHNGETSSVVNAGSIESYEMSEFSNFKSSFDEIQEKLDAELEFNNDQMIKWNDELDDSSSMLSSQSTSNLSASDIGKTLGKQQKNGFMLT